MNRASGEEERVLKLEERASQLGERNPGMVNRAPNKRKGVYN